MDLGAQKEVNMTYQNAINMNVLEKLTLNIYIYIFEDYMECTTDVVKSNEDNCNYRSAWKFILVFNALWIHVETGI